MSTFIGQLVGFTIIVYGAWRFVVPLLRRLMADQQQSVRAQLAESAAAADRLAKASQVRSKAVADANAEAQRVTEEARADAERIVEQMRAQADAEVERIKAQGTKQVELLRSQLIHQLRQDIGYESVRRAGELVRGHVAEPARQSATVDRFLDELDAMAASATHAEYSILARMRSASREALSKLVQRFEEVAENLDDEALSTLAEDLASVVGLLNREVVVTRYLAVQGEDSAPRVHLMERLVSGKVGAPALDVLSAAVSARWSASSDLVDAVEHVARHALLIQAERAGQIAEVEDQLFRFSRILDEQPRLAILLGDSTAPAESRVQLERNILGHMSSDVNPIAVSLLLQTIELLRGQRVEDAVQGLTEVVMARRGEVVAQVGAATELAGAQRARLVEVLSRIYGRPVTVQIQIDPAYLGGLRIAVGDEVIDGTLSARLAAAEVQLPD